ncbi:MAG: hypothetical protein LIO62_08265 [Clostridiales bacterium]|nr:hypothetical protein [Clostridiales bacterium]
MPKQFNLTPQMQEYFDSLSEAVKESIIQSTASINSLEDLKSVAQEFANGTEK